MSIAKKFDINDENAELFSDDFQEEMVIRTEMLRQTGYLNAAEWCEHIRAHLHLYPKHPDDLARDLQLFLDSFKDDFLDRVEGGNRKLRQDCFEVIQVLLERAIQNSVNVNETLKQLVPLADRSLAANKPIYRMDESFNALNVSLLEVKVYGFLCTFMLHVDGQYFPTIKTLCALKLAGERRKYTLEYIENLKLEQMQTLIGEFGSPIFEVYNSVGRKLRNAIAHCNFLFTEQKLTCWDIDPRTKQEIWRKEFTLTELMATINDLKSVDLSFSTWFVVRALAEKISRSIGHDGLYVKFKYA